MNISDNFNDIGIATPPFDKYTIFSNVYDELLSQEGVVRNQWLQLFQTVGKIGKEGLLKRHLEIQNLLRENGVTYNVYGDPAGLYRPWKLDALPLIIPEQEWKLLEEGLIQRADLLNKILKDIYGPRSVIPGNILPQELIYNHEGFLRQCEGIQLPGENQLIIYAADIARDSTGKFLVINDRTQAPSGSGYALENRSVMTSVFPELFLGYKVRNITGFFQAFQRSLRKIAPAGVESPRIVLLTPGTGNETFFEHAFLSAYLGINLVQGDDLTVRGDFVWMKTIKGLEKVDIIIRRIDDTFCDPLELRMDSRLGVAGLLEVARKGNVCIANPVGSSILENSGLMAFMPGLCKYFLNEELKLPNVNSWWCGQKKELNYVLDNLDHLVIKMIGRKGKRRTISETVSDENEKKKLREQILENPQLYVAQEKLSVATTPALINGEPEGRLSVIRCFVIASEEGYKVMPGGLTRSSAEKGSIRVSNQYGGISKDTWVLGNESENYLAEYIPTVINNGNENRILGSRAAENLYWTGRYAARSKGITRYLIQVIHQLNQHSLSPRSASTEAVRILLRAVTELTYIYPGFSVDDAEDKISHPEAEIYFTICSAANPNTLFSNIQYLKRAIFASRDQWPGETWHIIDRLDTLWMNFERRQPENLRLLKNTLETANDAFNSLTGLYEEAAQRDHGYQMFNSGYRIEKALQLASLFSAVFRNKAAGPVESILLESVLSSSMSLSVYRSRFRSQIQIENFLDLMIFDTCNPSSLFYQLQQLKLYFSALPRKSHYQKVKNEERLLMQVIQQIESTDSFVLNKTNGDSHYRQNLDRLLDNIRNSLSACSDNIVQTYFNHSEPAHSIN